MLASSSSSDSEARERTEYRREKIWEGISVFVGALIGGVHAYAANDGHIDTVHASVQIFTEGVIFGVLGYLLKQTDIIRSRFGRFQAENKRDRVRIIETEIDTKQELHKLCIRAEKSMEIKDGIYGTIGEAFAHQNTMVRRFLMGSIRESLRPLEISSDELVASSELFTRSLYGNFWDELLEEQERRGSKRPLQVYLSHASSISVFQDDGAQDDLLVSQEKFSVAGGKIRRVLIRNSDLESKEDYEAVMTRMKSIETDVRLLDLGNNKALRQELTKDFLLVKIDGQPYVLEWLWLPSGGRHQIQIGQVHGTRVHLTAHGCREFYDAWGLILRRLRAKNPQEDLTGWSL
jgi:hypothetical protein